MFRQTGSEVSYEAFGAFGVIGGNFIPASLHERGEFRSKGEIESPNIVGFPGPLGQQAKSCATQESQIHTVGIVYNKGR